MVVFNHCIQKETLEYFCILQEKLKLSTECDIDEIIKQDIDSLIKSQIPLFLNNFVTH